MTITQTPGTYEPTRCPGASHCSDDDAWAYDFDNGVPNWLVVAAHAGKVTSVKFDGAGGSCPPDYSHQNDANFVVLDHTDANGVTDGYQSIYYHLMTQDISGQLIQGQQPVFQGHPLAYADTTGLVCGSPGQHLHFAVQATGTTASVEAKFDELGTTAPYVNELVTSQNRKRYDSSYLGGMQSLTLAAGVTYQLAAQWQNTGWDIWYFTGPNPLPHPVRAGTWSPAPGQDQGSLIGGAPGAGCPASTDWIACNRIRFTTDTVQPDQTGWFQFTVKAPLTAGSYQLCLKTMAEGYAWFGPDGVCLWLTVPVTTTPPPGTSPPATASPTTPTTTPSPTAAPCPSATPAPTAAPPPDPGLDCGYVCNNSSIDAPVGVASLICDPATPAPGTSPTPTPAPSPAPTPTPSPTPTDPITSDPITCWVCER